MPQYPVVAFFIPLVCTVTACGGSTLSPPSGTGGSGTGGNVGIGGSAAATAAGGGSGLATGGGVATGGNTGATEVGGASGQAPDAGPTPAPGGTISTIPCGNTQCAIPGETCCILDNNGAVCIIAGTNCAAVVGGANQGEGAGLKCSGAANCAPGTVCCLSQDPITGATVSVCAAACAAGDPQLCDPAALVTGCAGDAGVCSSNNIDDWGLPATFGTCGGVGM
jgi:hypothetical protein